MSPTMVKSWAPLWISLIIIQSCFHHGQTNRIKHRSTVPLDIDQAYFTVINQNHTTSVNLTYNFVVCEECDFTTLFDSLDINTTEQKVIDTRFGYDFQVLSTNLNQTVLCSINGYQFSEHGSYTFEISQTNSNETVCLIHDAGVSSNYWTPIIVAVVLLISFIIVVQLWHHVRHSSTFQRVWFRFGQRAVVQQDSVSTTPRSGSYKGRLASADNQDLWTNADDKVTTDGRSPLVSSLNTLNSLIRVEKSSSKRLHSLDTFRGFSLMIMIFVNYGGGGYWFFDHSIWNGLTLADLVFPWFAWMMGVSIVLSQRSLRAKRVSRISIFLKLSRRTVVLFFLGLILQGGSDDLKKLRILGVLQRLALCYFFTAVIVLIFSESDAELESTRFTIVDNVQQPMRTELVHSIFRYWMQWLCVLILTLTWLLLTFVPKFENCPAGYLGPGGKHKRGIYADCTGGMAGYIDRLILGTSHVYDGPTCKEIYDTKLSYDPEGILGTLTGILLCYLGAQAGHIFTNSTRPSRICGQWIAFGLICGTIGLILSKGGHSESWIPINKNLWSLSFVLVLASLAFFILTILYLCVDVYKRFNGEPWLWLGMNSIVVFVGHEICSERFPIQFAVDNTHPKRLAINAYGATFWTIVTGIMYYKKCFVSI